MYAYSQRLVGGVKRGFPDHVPAEDKSGRVCKTSRSSSLFLLDIIGAVEQEKESAFSLLPHYLVCPGSETI